MENTLHPTLLEALLALHLTPKLSHAKARKLIDYCDGSPIKALQFVDAPNWEAVEKERKMCERLNIELLPYTSASFPEKLKTLPDCPLILYIKGTLPAKHTACIGIVGTRCATTWGKESAYLFAKELARGGVCIVSGLARGIDTAAHMGSLETGSTLAIIGSGLANIYPKENSALAEKIASSNGAVVSELPLFTPPARHTFPQRNRLIAALSDALLLAEAPIKSGAMITMELGRKENKPLFTLPGRAMSPTYEGNHLLIKQRKAHLVETPSEIQEALHLPSTPMSPQPKKLEGIEQKILDFISQGEVSIDELSCVISLPTADLQALLIHLLLKNLIVECPGKRYKLRR